MGGTDIKKIIRCRPSKKRRKNSKKVLDWFFKAKSHYFCIICNESRSDLLELHHIDPLEKSFNVYSAILNGVRLSAIKKEIQKTAPLCKNHHRGYHKDILYESEKVLYDLFVFIKYEHNDWEDIDNLDYLLSCLDDKQIEFVNYFYEKQFKA